MHKSIAMGDAYRRKVIFLGQSGAGKSTVLNAVYNSDVSRESLVAPARVGMTASGVTSEVLNYITIHGTFLTDTIGFDDMRFNPEDLALEMRRVLRASRIGFTHIVLVLPLGRITAGTRIYLAMLETMFGKLYKANLALYISRCDDGTTAEEFMEANSSDPDLSPLYQQLQANTGDNSRIITGTLMCHRNPDRDRKSHFPDRLETLSKLQYYLDTKLGALNPPAKDPFELVGDFLEFVMCKVLRLKESLGTVLTALRSNTVTVRNFFPECAVCLSSEYTQDDMAMQLSCGHIFHQECCRIVLQRDAELQGGIDQECFSQISMTCPNCCQISPYPGEALEPALNTEHETF